MSFINELKRRNVLRVAIAYAIVAWVVLQIADILFPILTLPGWAIRLVAGLLIVGFPVALLFAWAFELTPDGLKRESDVDRSQSITRNTGRKLDFSIIGLLVIAIAFLIVDNYMLDDATDRNEETVAGEISEPASVEEMVFPLPDKPSIVVLPFDNMSGDEEQEYFVDGITEDLTTDLSKLPGLFVIARNSAFTYKGRSVSVKQVAEELGVQYIVEGSVRRVGDRIRINAQFIDALSGHHVWAERYDGSLVDVFSLQDNVVGQIVSALAINVPGAEEALWMIGGTDDLEAYEAALQGWDYYHRQTPEDSARAITFFERAIELDPGYSRAYAGLGRIYWDISNLWFITDSGSTWQQTFDLAKANLAMSMREPTAEAYALSAEINSRMGKHDEALADIDRAIASGPSIADNNIVKARILNAVGRAAGAEELVRHAMRSDPQFKPAYSRVLAHSLLHQEQYGEAARYLELTTGREAGNPYDYMSLAVAYGYLGRFQDASAAIDQYHELSLEHGYSTPMTVQEIDKWWYGDMFDYDNTYKERLLVGLRKAGLPEGPAPAQGDLDYRLLMSRDNEILSVRGAPTIELETAREMWEQGAIFIDVRDRIAFNAGHLPGAIHFDLHVDFTDERLSEVVGRNEEVVISCWGRNCPYAAHACAMALTWGFNKVYYFAGGFPAWLVAGYPIEDVQD
jgi:TolB-like protein/tetratricopeptide (TPR) repeat protein